MSNKKLRLKNIKLNELIIIEEYVYMFVRPKTASDSADSNGLILMQIVFSN